MLDSEFETFTHAPFKHSKPALHSISTYKGSLLSAQYSSLIIILEIQVSIKVLTDPSFNVAAIVPLRL